MAATCPQSYHRNARLKCMGEKVAGNFLNASKGTLSEVQTYVNLLVSVSDPIKCPAQTIYIDYGILRQRKTEPPLQRAW